MSSNVSFPSQVEQIEVYPMFWPGVLVAYEGTAPLPLEGLYSLQSVRFTLRTPSDSGDVILDVKCNGESIYNGNLPRVLQGERTARGNSNLSKRRFERDDELTVDIVSPGLNLTASDLTVILRLKRLF